jgi:hypothetical protein
MLRHLRMRWPLFAGITVLAMGIFVAEAWNLYYRFPHFDKIMHILGGLAVAWFALSLFQDELVRWPGWKQFVVLAATACLVGVLWEFAEYFANFAQHTYPAFYHWFHGGDLTDTLSDIAADIGGGTLLALWALREERT